MKYQEFRLIISNKDSAKNNMATDEALINLFDEKFDLPILRFYTWEKSFTIGAGQKFEDYDYIKGYNGNKAKRVTGGGVLFHGHDLSYSLILPREYLKDFTIKQAYEKICSFILDFYKELNLDIKYAKDDENIKLSKSSFCQIGYEAYDMVCNKLKLGGNAQKWTKKVVFQHGSIPIKAIKVEQLNKDALGNSLVDLNINLEYSEAIEYLKKSFEKTFDVRLVDSKLNEKELDRLTFLLKDKYDYAK